jgi:hypothetical protein
MVGLLVSNAVPAFGAKARARVFWALGGTELFYRAIAPEAIGLLIMS